MKNLKLEKEEKEILEEVERGEWKSISPSSRDLEYYKSAAKKTLKKDKRVNIRMTERDLSTIQKIALEEGIPYQTLISSVLHKYVNRRIKV